MSAIAQWILALSAAALAYIYLGYPLLVWLLARMRPRRSLRSSCGEDRSVTVITAAFNEADVIADNVRNKLESDYPAGKLDMIVISDESSDGTDEIVRELATRYPGRLQLIRQQPRRGKTAGLNLAVPRARGEILVFADANSIYEPGAIRRLVERFDDPEVGYVTGKMIYANPDGSVTGDGCTAYMRYENALRAWESATASVVGVDGGIDAVRKSLYREMRADQLPDFVLPLRVVEQGFRVVYEPSAVLREDALNTPQQEYRMRVRVALRALWALYDLRPLLNPLRRPLFAWQLASHKLWRYLAFLPQFALFLANLVLAIDLPPYRLLLAAQLGFYLLAAIGHFSQRSFALATTAYYLCLLNLSCAHACLRFLRGERQAMWQPRVG